MQTKTLPRPQFYNYHFIIRLSQVTLEYSHPILEWHVNNYNEMRLIYMYIQWQLFGRFGLLLAPGPPYYIKVSHETYCVPSLVSCETYCLA